MTFNLWRGGCELRPVEVINIRYIGEGTLLWYYTNPARDFNQSRPQYYATDAAAKRDLVLLTAGYIREGWTLV